MTEAPHRYRVRATIQSYTPERRYKIERYLIGKWQSVRPSDKGCGSRVMLITEEAASECGKYAVVDVDNCNEVLGLYDTLEEARAEVHDTAVELRSK
jgi:hypothetical protein